MEIITRKEAQQKGLRRFYTGKPCQEGHDAERMTSNRLCVVCATRKKIEWAKKNNKKILSNLRARRLKNPQKYQDYDRSRYHADPRMKMLSAAKRRAKSKGIPFDITIEDIVIPTHCPLLGINLIIGDGVITDNSPSLDRIKNKYGYVRGNVIVTSHIANRCKGSLGSAHLLILASNLRELERKVAIQ